jgi:Flp pilus assembly pilin Flp
MTARVLSKLQRRRGDRGATLVEYAMIMALVVVVSIGAIQMVQESGEERLDSTDVRVNADDGAYYAGGGSPPTSSGATTTAPPGPVEVHLDTNPTITVADATGNRWQVTITFTLLDSSGDGVIGATMNGSWTDGGNGSTPVGSCTTSTGAGQCTVQYTKIRDAVQDVSFTLSTITGGTFTWVPEVPGEGSITVNCGPVC